LTSGEQLGHDVQVWVDFSSSVNNGNSNVQWGRVAVVQTEAIEYTSKLFGILDHVLPEPWAILPGRAVPEFDAVAPDNYLSAKVCLGWVLGKVLQWVGSPHPTIVGEE
jgi:hypothetical protein